MTTPLNTAFVLTMRYQSSTITLDEIRRQWLPHLSPEEAQRKANAQTLPFPVFRADKNSRKSPYLANIAAVAAWLDSQAADAEHEWHKVND